MNPEDTNPTRVPPEEPLTPQPRNEADPVEVPEPLDDGTFTPPHGDPVGEAALEPPATLEANPVTREGASNEPSQNSFAEKVSSPYETTDEVVHQGVASTGALYTGPVEPAPLGDLFVTSESEAHDAGTRQQSGGHEVDGAETHAQPEPLYTGPMEPAPAGLFFDETLTDGEQTEVQPAAGEATKQPRQALNDDLEAAALASSTVPAEAESPVGVEEQPEGGPNWMLAFICAWSSMISLREAWATVGGGGFGQALHNLGVMGYLLLGVGLLAFALDALQWGRPRRGVGPLVLPALLTLAGVVCLVLWNNPGRPI